MQFGGSLSLVSFGDSLSLSRVVPKWPSHLTLEGGQAHMHPRHTPAPLKGSIGPLPSTFPA